jgi:hypothetical protein
MNPAHERILRYFSSAHLPEPLHTVSAPIGVLAQQLAEMLQDSHDPAEVTAGLRKLLEAKDCLVRARLA